MLTDAQVCDLLDVLRALARAETRTETMQTLIEACEHEDLSSLSHEERELLLDVACHTAEENYGDHKWIAIYKELERSFTQ